MSFRTVMQYWRKEYPMCKDLEVIHVMTSYVQKWSKLYEMHLLILPEAEGSVRLQGLRHPR